MHFLTQFITFGSVTCCWNTEDLQLTAKNSLKSLSDSVGAQVDDLHQIVSGARKQLGAVMVQVQRRHSAQQLQLPDDTLRSDKRAQITYRTNVHTHDMLEINYNINLNITAKLMYLHVTNT